MNKEQQDNKKEGDCGKLPELPSAYDWELFRQNGHKTIDFIADYFQSLNAQKLPVKSSVQPGYLSARKEKPPTTTSTTATTAITTTSTTLPEEIPELSTGFNDIIKVVEKEIIPGMTHWQHPQFYGFFPCLVSPPALLGDILANSFNQPGFNWMCCPAATELEIVVMDWLVTAFSLPSSRFSWRGTGGGVIQPSATEAAIVGLLAAKTSAAKRQKELHGTDVNETYGKLVCYVSDQAHFCVEKAARVLTIPHFRKIISLKDPITSNFPMNINLLKQTIETDISNGLIPFFVSGNYGTTGTCATDNLTAIGEIAQKYKLWYNVDAAYAGVTALLPEMRQKMAGIEMADSILINGSKWLGTMMGGTFFFFADKTHVESSLNATGAILSNPLTEAGKVVDFKDYHLGLGRPFRSLKVYTVLASFGLNGLRDVLRRHMILAKYLAEKLTEEKINNVPIIEVPIKPEFGLVCFRLNNGNDNLNNKLLNLLMESNKAFLVHTVSDGKVLLRIALSSPVLTHKDMDELAALVLQNAKIVLQQ